MEQDSFSAQDLFSSFVQRYVVGASNQVPQYIPIPDSGDAEGDFVFVRKPTPGSQAHSTPSKLPANTWGASSESVALVSDIASPRPAPPQPESPQHLIKDAGRSESGQETLTAKGFGDLTVAANADGARILIDGVDTGEVTPHKFLGMPVGLHRVALIKEGYGTAVSDFNVSAGAPSNAELQLNVPSGSLEITTIPPGADVFIDGKICGKSPVSATLPAGQHQWQVTLGGMAKQGTVNVPADGLAERDVELRQ